jgi:UTP--glucose-1-phosphate uridylyltransferase
MPSSPPNVAKPSLPKLAELINDDKAFENTSTSVAASQMRNALNNLADTVTDPEEKKVQFLSIPSTHWIKADLILALRD